MAPAVVTRREPGLLSAPTPNTLIRQLPAALDVDPVAIKPPPLEFSLKQPEVLTLPNGLQVYLLEDHTAPLVLLRALVPVGGVDDPAAKLGLASVTATLVTESGAGTRTPEVLDELLEFHAADVSSGAGDEYSTVTLSLRSVDLAKLFPVFADLVQRPRFEAARFDVATGRFLEGIRRREDRPDGVAARALNKAVFGPTSPLGREATEATVKAITVADVKKLHASTWGAKSTRLIVTGDFDPKALRALLEQEFAGWKGGAPPPRQWPAPPPLVRRVIVVPRKIAQAKVRLGAWGFPRNTPLEFPLRLANTTLGTFGVGRLYKEIRDERGLAYSAYSSVNPGPTTGQFTAGFDTKPEQVVEALEVATRILHDLGTGAPMSEAELRTSSDIATNAFAFRFDSAAKIAFERATYDLFGYPQDYLSTWRAKIGAVGAAQASEAARQFDAGLQIIVVGPVDKLGDLSRFGPVSTITDVEQFFPRGASPPFR
ncbi:MAG: pitrilysin family protein [Archangium sp.]|nr:pitrilysin family protein [Archangium sp.]